MGTDERTNRGATSPRTDGKASPRILLPLERLGKAGPTHFRFALLLARAYGGEILAIRVRTPEMPDAPQWGWAPSAEDVPEDVPVEIREIEAATVAEGILQTAREESSDLILLYWRSPAEALRTRLSRLLDPVIGSAPCDVLLLRGDPVEVATTQAKHRFLVGVGGSKNASAALQVALNLARQLDGEVILVTVIGETATAEEERRAETLLATVTDHSGVLPEERETLVFPRVIRSDDVERALSQAAKNHTIALFGAPELSVLNQLLTRTIVERLMASVPTPMLVVRRYGTGEYWTRRAWQQLDRLIPDVSAEERLDAYKRVRRGARANHDFYLLMLFSTIIATMGLLLNSVAVIIGAMLVAPLMTPMLGLALGVVMGDGRLLQVSGRSTATGLLLAVGVSALLAALVPLPAFTEEIVGRTQPNLLDLTVGLAAGAAGAYAISRHSVAASLPGVAIAVALVPPLCVVGICLASGRWAEAGGAMLLFGTNLVAISSAGAFIYMLLGFFPQSSKERRQGRLRTGLVLILMLLFGISIPLVRSSINQVFDRSFNRTITQLFREEDGLALLNMDWEKGRDGEPLSVRVVLIASRTMTPALRQEIQDRMELAAGQPVDLRILIVPLHELESTPVVQQ